MDLYHYGNCVDFTWYFVVGDDLRVVPHEDKQILKFA